MAHYWVYLNGDVAGPYGVEQLIRLRGFSRRALVCVDDASGVPRDWITPAGIPELAHIFKAVDEHELPSPPASGAKPLVKPAPGRPVPKTRVPVVFTRPRAASKWLSQIWGWGVVVGVLGGLLMGGWLLLQQRYARGREQQAAQTLVEQVRLPPPSAYASVRHYLDEKRIHPRWDVERAPTGLYNVTLSWYAGAGALAVYAFEVNVQAQSVRGLNTAAARLLTEGFPSPSAPKPVPSRPAPPPAHRSLGEGGSPARLFSEATEHHRDALEKGDFVTVWGSFSHRKKAEMAKAGISQEGFVRLQSLTHRVESGIRQTVLKTKKESEREMLLLLKQSQARHPDVYVKQLWVFEDNEWKLDDEEKRALPDGKQEAPPPAKPDVPVTSLPGLSNQALSGIMSANETFAVR